MHACDPSPLTVMHAIAKGDTHKISVRAEKGKPGNEVS